MPRLSPLCLVFLALIWPVCAVAQTPASPDPLMALPESEVVVTVDVKRLLGEALPRLMANAPAARARLESELEKVRAQTGFDLRGVERLVVGLGDLNLAGRGAFEAREAAMPGRMVAIMTGNFDAAVLVAAARLAVGGKYREEAYGGLTLYTLTVEPKSEGLPVSAGGPTELSVVALGPHALAAGLPASVRAVVDAHQRPGGSGANAELLAMATNNPDALIGVGADLRSWARRRPPAERAKSSRGLQIDPLDRLGSVEPPAPAMMTAGPGAELMKTLESIRQVFFSAGMAPGTFNLHLVARTAGAAEVESLNRLLTSLHETTNSVTDPRARRIIDAIQFFTQGNEMQIRADFAQADVAALVTDRNLSFGRPGATSARATRRRPRRAR